MNAKVFIALWLGLHSLIYIATAQAEIVFGPATYVRNAGEPIVEVNTFSPSFEAQECILSITNGGLKDNEENYEFVSSSTIILNGTNVLILK